MPIRTPMTRLQTPPSEPHSTNPRSVPTSKRQRRPPIRWAQAWTPFLPAAATERCDSTIFSHSVSTRVGRVLIIALRCVLAQRDNASDRQPLEAFWRGIIELQVDTR